MNKVIEEYAAYLASLNENDRVIATKQVNLLAAGQAEERTFDAPIKTLDEYLNTPIPTPPTVVGPHGLLVRGAITATIGRAGVGKSVMNQNRIIRWAAGLPMFDELSTLSPKDGPVKTLMIENEGAAGLFHAQMGTMVTHSPLSAEQRKMARENILVWGDGGYSDLKLDDTAKLDLLRSGLEQHSPDILFIEPFRGLWKGEENSSTDMTEVLNTFQALASEFECAILVAHHERKGGLDEDGEKMSLARGSGAFEGAVAVMENWQKVVSGKYRELSWSKNRHGPEPEVVRMEWQANTLWYRRVPGDETARKILEVLKENLETPLSTAKLSEDTGESQRKLKDVLDDLVTENRVVKMKRTSTGPQTYRINTNGGDSSSPSRLEIS